MRKTENVWSFLRELRALSSAFSVLNLLFFLGFSWDKVSLAATTFQVKPRQSRAPMIEFRAAELHESIRAAENSGIRAGRETLSRRGDRAPQAPAIRGHRLRQGGPSSHLASGFFGSRLRQRQNSAASC